MKSKIKKQQLLEQLKLTPIVELACKKAGLSRSSYYRWLKDDASFAKLADEALHEGALLINDMAESQLISAIKDKNMTAIVYWLKHHHRAYADRLELSGHLQLDEELTPEQASLVRQALRLANLNNNSGGIKELYGQDKKS